MSETITAPREGTLSNVVRIDDEPIQDASVDRAR